MADEKNIREISDAKNQLRAIFTDIQDAFSLMEPIINVLETKKTELESLNILKFGPEYDINISSLSDAGEHIRLASGKLGEFISQVKRSEYEAEDKNPREDRAK